MRCPALAAGLLGHRLADVALPAASSGPSSPLLLTCRSASATPLRPSANFAWSLVSSLSTCFFRSAYARTVPLSSLTASCWVCSPPSTGGAPASSTAGERLVRLGDLLEGRGVGLLDVLRLAVAVDLVIAVLASLIFFVCGLHLVADALRPGVQLLAVSSPHPDSARTSAAPPDSAATSFLFTGLVPSMALGPGTYTARRVADRAPWVRFVVV